MAFTVTAATVDSDINTARTHMSTGNYVEARRYLAMAEIDKEAMFRQSGEDGKQSTWGNAIAAIFNAIEKLEAAEARTNGHSRFIKTKIQRGG